MNARVLAAICLGCLLLSRESLSQVIFPSGGSPTQQSTNGIGGNLFSLGNANRPYGGNYNSNYNNQLGSYYNPYGSYSNPYGGYNNPYGSNSNPYNQYATTSYNYNPYNYYTTVSPYIQTSKFEK